MAKACEEGGNVSVGQYLFLNSLRHRPLRPGWIAQVSGITRQRVAQTARALEDRGLISRKRDTADARAFVLSLTSDGVAAIEAVDNQVRIHLRDAIPNDQLEAFGAELWAIKQHNDNQFRRRLRATRGSLDTSWEFSTE